MTQAWEKQGIDKVAWAEAVEKLLVMLAPMAPHVTEELWERNGHEFTVHNQTWPEWDPKLAADEVVTLVVQVNGRLRDRVEVPVSTSEEDAKSTALERDRIKPYVEGKEVSRVVYVPGKLVNIVTG